MSGSKRNIHQRIKGFTLTEVLVTMAITSFLVLVSYMAFQFLGSYFRHFQSQSAVNSERLGFNTVFSRQWEEADSIKAQGKNLRLYTKSGVHHWLFQGDSIVFEGLVFRAGNHAVSHQLPDSLPALAAKKYVSAFHIAWREGTQDSISFRYVKSYPLSLMVNL